MANDGNHGTAMAMDEMATLFQPDSLLPVQFFDNFLRKVQTEPEKSLMLAVLEDALSTYQKHFTSRGGRGLRLFRETEEWIYREHSNRPFSFANICEVVGFDPEYIRQGLIKWRQMRINEFASMNFAELEPIKIKMPKVARAERSRMIGLAG
jgi:hypothetical protein